MKFEFPSNSARTVRTRYHGHAEQVPEEGDPYLHAAWPRCQRWNADSLTNYSLIRVFAKINHPAVTVSPLHSATPVITRFSANYVPLHRTMQPPLACPSPTSGRDCLFPSDRFLATRSEFRTREVGGPVAISRVGDPFIVPLFAPSATPLTNDRSHNRIVKHQRGHSTVSLRSSYQIHQNRKLPPSEQPLAY